MKGREYHKTSMKPLISIQDLIDNVPEAIDGLQKPHRNKPFSDVFFSTYPYNSLPRPV